jgi:histidyl-tRNA synthetase
MIVEAELISAVSDILNRLRFDNFVIKINHRKILAALLDEAGVERDKHIDALTALDKLDKIGIEGVKKEFEVRGLSETAFESISGLFSRIEEHSRGSYHIKESSHIRQPDLIAWNDFSFKEVNRMIGENEEGKKALVELQMLLQLLNKSNHWRLQFSPNLARGLSYYTGAIFEISVGKEIGSLGAGGRYDGLIGMFGKEAIPACGFSLGLERILVLMSERGMFLELEEQGILNAKPADILVTIWNEKNIADSIELANELRAQGLRVAIYPVETDKLGKQFKYASSIGVSAVAILGDDERANNAVTIKYLETGDQETISRESLSTELRI